MEVVAKGPGVWFVILAAGTIFLGTGSLFCSGGDYALTEKLARSCYNLGYQQGRLHGIRETIGQKIPADDGKDEARARKICGGE